MHFWPNINTKSKLNVKWFKLSVPNVLLNSPNLSSYLSLNKFERILFLIFSLFDQFSFSHYQMSYFVCDM